jgi:hypothetical protein
MQMSKSYNLPHSKPVNFIYADSGQSSEYSTIFNDWYLIDYINPSWVIHGTTVSGQSYSVRVDKGNQIACIIIDNLNDQVCAKHKYATFTQFYPEIGDNIFNTIDHIYIHTSPNFWNFA